MAIGRIRRTVLNVFPFDNKSFVLTVKDYPICKPSSKTDIEAKAKKIAEELSRAGIRSQIDFWGKNGNYVKSQQFNESGLHLSSRVRTDLSYAA